ncbi:MAG TPA: hypothetical protein VLM90_10245 [Candidatus Deferrimicrobium sp.]|nr:hypothetical protein [Candidatus Deferrimicrobium sp.]
MAFTTTRSTNRIAKRQESAQAMMQKSKPKSHAHASEQFCKYENNSSKKGHCSAPAIALINQRNPAPGDLAISASLITIAATLAGNRLSALREKRAGSV